jgi:ankyrin repeat protein
MKTIHEAVRLNNVKELEAIVDRGANINDIDVHSHDKFTALHWAANSGSLEVCITRLITNTFMSHVTSSLLLSVCIGFFGER